MRPPLHHLDGRRAGRARDAAGPGEGDDALRLFPHGRSRRKAHRGAPEGARRRIRHISVPVGGPRLLRSSRTPPKHTPRNPRRHRDRVRRVGAPPRAGGSAPIAVAAAGDARFDGGRNSRRGREREDPELQPALRRDVADPGRARRRRKRQRGARLRARPARGARSLRDAHDGPLRASASSSRTTSCTSRTAGFSSATRRPATSWASSPAAGSGAFGTSRSACARTRSGESPCRFWKRRSSRRPTDCSSSTSTGRSSSYNRKFVDMWRIPDPIVAARDDKRAISYVLDQLKSPEAFVKKVRDLYVHPESQSFDWLEFKDGRIFERYSQPHRVARTDRRARLELPGRDRPRADGGDPPAPGANVRAHVRRSHRDGPRRHGSSTAIPARRRCSGTTRRRSSGRATTF